jgi:hypothetical protein
MTSLFFLFNTGLEHGHVFGQSFNTNHSIGTISNTTQSYNYAPTLPMVPSQGPILLPISTENTSLLGRAQREGLS